MSWEFESPLGHIEMESCMKMLPITNCGDCPNMGSERYYTADSWEYVESWFCKKTDRPQTARTDRQSVKDDNLIGYAEGSHTPKKIPDWCPL